MSIEMTEQVSVSRLVGMSVRKHVRTKQVWVDMSEQVSVDDMSCRHVRKSVSQYDWASISRNFIIIASDMSQEVTVDMSEYVSKKTCQNSRCQNKCQRKC